MVRNSINVCVKDTLTSLRNSISHQAPRASGVDRSPSAALKEQADEIRPIGHNRHKYARGGRVDRDQRCQRSTLRGGGGGSGGGKRKNKCLKAPTKSIIVISLAGCAHDGLHERPKMY